MQKLTLISWNVNGLRSIYGKGFLTWLKQENPDIVCLQETKAQPEQLPDDLLNIPGYHVYYSSAIRKGYSGVALYTKLPPQQISFGFGIDRFDSEGRIIIAEFPVFNLLNIYFPNGQMSDERLKYKLEFYDAFQTVVNRFIREGKNVIIGGDVNTAHTEIDLSHPRQNAMISGFLPEERAWIDQFLAQGYYDTFRLFDNSAGNYTWWSPLTHARERNIGWRIDYFFINKTFRSAVLSAGILKDVMGSDHCPISLKIAF